MPRAQVGQDDNSIGPVEMLLGVVTPPPSPQVAPATVSSSGATVSSAPPTAQVFATVSSTPIPGQGIALDSSGKLSASIQVQAIPVVTADPASPVIGQVWYRQDTSQLCVRHDLSTTKRVTLA